MPPSFASPSSSAQFPHFVLFLLLPFLFHCIHAGTWLSFNQNTGGMELADRLLSAPFRGKSIADVVANGQFGPEQNVQLAGLVRMCRERVKRSPVSQSAGQRNSIEHLDDLCAALLQLSKEKRGGGGRGTKRFSRFVPIRMDQEEEDLLLW